MSFMSKYNLNFSKDYFSILPIREITFTFCSRNWHSKGQNSQHKMNLLKNSFYQFQKLGAFCSLLNWETVWGFLTYPIILWEQIK